MPLKGIYLKSKENGDTKIIDIITNLKAESTAIRVDSGMHQNTFTEEYTGAQDDVVLLSPNEGNKLCVRKITTNVSGDGGTISIDFPDSEKKVHRHYSHQQNRSSSIEEGHILGGTDEDLVLNAPDLGSEDLFVVVTYIEHK